MNQDLQDIHKSLGISDDYGQQCGMALHPECTTLVDVEPDVFGRPARLEPGTALAWRCMNKAAAESGICLQLVSAYRSYAYQAQLLQGKLQRGDALHTILQVNAAPGYSEHHSGRAIDLGCPEFPYLEEHFEHSPAFSWLQSHADNFGFRMSFPRNNPFGVLYEPWHWYYSG